MTQFTCEGFDAAETAGLRGKAEAERVTEVPSEIGFVEHATYASRQYSPRFPLSRRSLAA
jgi:hypothetical protein